MLSLMPSSSIQKLANSDFPTTRRKRLIHFKNFIKDFSESDGNIDWAYVYNFIKSEPKAGYYDLELEVSGEKIILTDDAIRVRVKGIGCIFVYFDTCLNLRYGIYGF